MCNLYIRSTTNEAAIATLFRAIDQSACKCEARMKKIEPQPKLFSLSSGCP
jgi:hypothetical protein